MGRRPLIETAEQDGTLETFVNAFGNGFSPKVACQLVGISYRTYLNWRTHANQASDKKDRGEELTTTELKYLSFFREIMRANALFCKRNLDAIQEVSITKGDWRAAAWLLERADRDAFDSTNHNSLEQGTEQPVTQVIYDGSVAGEAMFADVAKSLGIDLPSLRKKKLR